MIEQRSFGWHHIHCIVVKLISSIKSILYYKTKTFSLLVTTESNTPVEMCTCLSSGLFWQLLPRSNAAQDP